MYLSERERESYRKFGEVMLMMEGMEHERIEETRRKREP